MTNTTQLIEILNIARKIGNQEIAKEAVKALALSFGMIVTISDAPMTLRDIQISAAISRSSKIPAIKELREKANVLGFDCGLKEAKEEIDRRVELLPTNQQYDISNVW